MTGPPVGWPLLVKEEKGKGRRLVAGVAGKDGVEAATLFLKIVSLSGQPGRGETTGCERHPWR